MKLLKNIIQLLVLTSLGLSVTPLTTAQAATTNKAIQVDTTSAKTSALDISLKSTGSSDTPTPASETVTPTDGSTTTDKEATSNVSVTVLSGILTLEAVPNFNFGTMMQGTTAKLKGSKVDLTGFNPDEESGKVTSGIDGNDDGLLEVIDSRNEGTKMPGFTLSASMGKLMTANGSESESLRAILSLGKLPLLDGDNNNVSNSSTDLYTQKASLDSGIAGNSAPVMNLQPGTYNAGVIKSNFTTPDSASLQLPEKAASTSSKVTQMNSIVTWTLSTQPTVTTD